MTNAPMADMFIEPGQVLMAVDLCTGVGHRAIDITATRPQPDIYRINIALMGYSRPRSIIVKRSFT